MTRSAPCCHAESPPLGRSARLGLLLVSLAVLAYEIQLTRIFSVTMGAGAGLLAVSVAMFGLTAGAVAVYLCPRWFSPDAVPRSMALGAIGFGVLIPITLPAHLRFGISLDPDRIGQWRHLAMLACDYAILSLPLIAAGVSLTAAIALRAWQAGRLYALYMAGSALACLAMAAASPWVEVPVLVLDTAAVALAAGLLCLTGRERRRLVWLAPAGVLFAVGIAGLNFLSATSDTPILNWCTRGMSDALPPLYERWNAFSRVTVGPGAGEPFGWGMSRRFHPEQPAAQLWMDVDASSGMVLTRFRSDLSEVDYLRYDVANLVHYLRSGARVLAPGAGGGRDVLTALVFRQREVIAVEVNETILDAAHRRFGEFTGHLDRWPGVKFVHEDARSYLAQDGPPFDIIHAPLFDNGVATPGKNYALPENSLYTVEAWQRMLQRLGDRGVASFSRGFTPRQPVRIYRLAAMAVTALQREGAARPRDHLMVVACPGDPKTHPGGGAATLLASRTPFRPEDVDTIERVARDLDFQVLLTPRGGTDPSLIRMTGGDLDGFVRDFPIDVAAATDDRPFCIGMMRGRDFAWLIRPPANDTEFDSDTIVGLGVSLIAVLGLTVLTLAVPWAVSFRRQRLAGSLPWFVYFGGLGLGFALVEGALVQRLGLFLGHPVHALDVVLSSLLAAAGAGSWLADRWTPAPRLRRRALAWLAIPTVLLPAAAFAVLPRLAALEGADISIRIAVAAALLLPLGLAVGAAFPLGMRAVGQTAEPLCAWLFAVYGATSMCGSVGVLVLSMCFGITASLLTAAVCFFIALIAFAWGRSG